MQIQQLKDNQLWATHLPRQPEKLCSLHVAHPWKTGVNKLSPTRERCTESEFE